MTRGYDPPLEKAAVIVQLQNLRERYEKIPATTRSVARTIKDLTGSVESWLERKPYVNRDAYIRSDLRQLDMILTEWESLYKKLASMKIDFG